MMTELAINKWDILPYATTTDTSEEKSLTGLNGMLVIHKNRHVLINWKVFKNL